MKTIIKTRSENNAGKNFKKLESKIANLKINNRWFLEKIKQDWQIVSQVNQKKERNQKKKKT